jgi:hypothetical protein
LFRKQALLTRRGLPAEALAQAGIRGKRVGGGGKSVGTKSYQPTANSHQSYRSNEAIYHNTIKLQISLNPKLNSGKINYYNNYSFKPKLKPKTNKSAVI